jgi:hypothetical protein
MTNVVPLWPNPAAAIQAREDALYLVMFGETMFAARVRAVVKRLPPGWIGITEDIRIEYTNRGYPPPHHHNCWGGATMRLVRDGILIPTGGWRWTRTTPAHRRKAMEYRL